MSFQEQERLLFDLLFDDELRQLFTDNSEQALSHYHLTDQEKNDFSHVRVDALEMDVAMRKRLILANMSNMLPLSFSLVSSLKAGLTLLSDLINTALMKTAPHQRVSAYAKSLQEHVALLAVSEFFHSEQEKQALLAILSAELGMAASAAKVKQALLNNQYRDAAVVYYEEDDDSWLEGTVQWAEFVYYQTINLPYMALKKKLCPVTGTALWQHLNANPLPAFLREETLEQQDPRVVVSKACITYKSELDPVVDHATVELSIGFAPMFNYIDGSLSIAALLRHLSEAGAPESLILSVRSGFYQLLQCGMLTVAR